MSCGGTEVVTLGAKCAKVYSKHNELVQVEVSYLNLRLLLDIVRYCYL